MFAAIGVALIAIVAWWRIGIIAFFILCGVSIFKMLYTKQFINRKLSVTQKVCLWSMIAYWILYAISAFVSTNHAGGWFNATIKLYFFILPILCLLSDTSYLTSSRIKALFQIYTGALLVRFAACVVISGIHLLQGIPFSEVKDWQIDPLGMHHNYLALYLDVAIAFLYAFVAQTPKSERRRRLPVVALAAAILIGYLFIISSRSGILTFALLFFVVLIHMAFFHRQKKTALLILLLSGVLLVGSYFVMPSLFSSFAVVKNWDENHVPNDRLITWTCGMKATRGHLLFGYGTGDYMPYLVDAFKERGFYRAIDKGYNTHCEYIETLLQTGLVGLVILLFVLLAPMVASLRRNGRNLTAVLVIIVILSMNLYEAMLNRQMGVQLIALVYCLLILSLTPSGKDIIVASRPSQSDVS